jgi:hypothetical protein
MHRKVHLGADSAPAEPRPPADVLLFFAISAMPFKLVTHLPF